MILVFSETAIADLEEVFRYSLENFPATTKALADKIDDTVTLIAARPLVARATSLTPDIRVAPVHRYPFLIFYRVSESSVEILHIRHAARQTWAG